jgi:hypothetical protein
MSCVGKSLTNEDTETPQNSEIVAALRPLFAR